MNTSGNKTNNLVKFVPDGIEVLLDSVAAVSDAGHADLDIGVALPFYHAPHEVVLGNQVLGIHQMDPQHPLWDRDRLWYRSAHSSVWIWVYLSCKLWVGRGVLWAGQRGFA